MKNLPRGRYMKNVTMKELADIANIDYSGMAQTVKLLRKKCL